ncbi:MAG: imidazoleglycerol-phosphate dehydratase HisB [Verrucomicrobiae bacterium]|nr:imidazoleglycerol-phosphate dehydratase HisB [Verrucomicrobiae bacterium]
MKKRRATVCRETAETQITVALTVDGQGRARIATGIPFFDHMLTLLAKHSLFDLDITACGDLDVDAHHLVEDTGIVLGQALREALGDRRSIRRYGWALIPMDETLAQCRVALDLSNRPFLVFTCPDWRQLARVELGQRRPYRVGLTREFLQGFTNEARCNLHVDVLRGDEPHHIVESIFKALARALDAACQRDRRVKGLPTTKGRL